MKPAIRVALLPALIDPESLSDHTVIVTDILRATSTICMALENGILNVLPTPDIPKRVMRLFGELRKCSALIFTVKRSCRSSPTSVARRPRIRCIRDRG